VSHSQLVNPPPRQAAGLHPTALPRFEFSL
jgi:hypothetical protein